MIAARIVARSLLGVVGSFSVFLFLGGSALWWRSYRAADWAFLAQGRVVFNSYPSEVVVEFYPPSPQGPWWGWERLEDVTNTRKGLMDFGINLAGGLTADVPPNLRFPTWAIAAAGAMLLMPIGLGLLSRTRRRGVGKCAQCGYDLTGNVSGTCPECGMRLHGPAA